MFTILCAYRRAPSRLGLQENCEGHRLEMKARGERGGQRFIWFILQVMQISLELLLFFFWSCRNERAIVAVLEGHGVRGDVWRFRSTGDGPELIKRRGVGGVAQKNNWRGADSGGASVVRCGAVGAGGLGDNTVTRLLDGDSVLCLHPPLPLNPFSAHLQHAGYDFSKEMRRRHRGRPALPQIPPRTSSASQISQRPPRWPPCGYKYGVSIQTH